jgi:hypothetical protein
MIWNPISTKEVGFFCLRLENTVVGEEGDAGGSHCV